MIAEARVVESGAECRQALVDELFRSLPRADQRHWARVYLKGLLCITKRITPRHLAAAQALPAGAAQNLHRFINGSSWSWEPVRQALAAQIAVHAAPTTWTVTDLFIPKRGDRTVGVGSVMDDAGQPVTGQQALGLLLGADGDSFPVSWRLLLRESWTGDRQLRRKARIPCEVTTRPRWAYLLELVGEVARGRLPKLPWVVALPLTPAEVPGVLGAFTHGGLDVVCEVGPEQQVLAEGGRAAAVPVRELMSRSRARSAPVRLSRRSHAESAVYRAVEWVDPDGDGPARYLLTNLGPRRAEQLFAHAVGDARGAMGAMSLRYGARDFLGRSFPGWHHHMTMASAAYAYQRLPFCPS